MTAGASGSLQIDGSVVGQLPPAIDHDQPAVVITLDPRARADADECSGQTVAQHSDRCIHMLRRKALRPIWTANMQVKFRGACLNSSPTIRDQCLNAYRQARVVVGRSGAFETGLDDHAGISASDGEGDGCVILTGTSCPTPASAQGAAHRSCPRHQGVDAG